MDKVTENKLLMAILKLRKAFYVDGTSKALKKAFEETKEIVIEAQNAYSLK